MHGVIGPPDIYVSEIFSYISPMTLKKISVSDNFDTVAIEPFIKCPFYHNVVFLCYAFQAYIEQ